MKLEWSMIILHQSSVSRKDGKILAFAVATNGENGFLATAIESHKDNNFKQVLDSHSHQVMGQAFHTVENAKKACEKFARKWLKGESIKECECENITEL